MFMTKKRFKEEVECISSLKCNKWSKIVSDDLKQIYKIDKMPELLDTIADLQKEVEESADIITELSRKINSMVSCESCGCLVLKENAVEGKSIIKRKNFTLDELIESAMFAIDLKKSEYIHTPYYCKFCAPEEE